MSVKKVWFVLTVTTMAAAIGEVVRLIVVFSNRMSSGERPSAVATLASGLPASSDARPVAFG
jgi:hypothetical protein